MSISSHPCLPLAAPLAWIVTAACWTAQTMLPWATSGTLSQSSQIDAFRLVRSGLVSSIAPPWVAYSLLLLPAVGLVAAATSGLLARRAAAIRRVLAVTAFVLVAIALHNLVSWDVSQLGPGGWAAVTGSATAVLACRLERPRTSIYLEASSPAHSPEVVS